MKNTKIKIDRLKWAEAGIHRGYISVDSSNNLSLNKVAFEPVTMSLLGIGVAMYALGELGTAGWDAATGGKSVAEAIRGFNATAESVAQFERGLISLREELKPLLQGTTLNIQEAVEDTLDQCAITLDQMNQELRSKGIAPPNIAGKLLKEQKEKMLLEKKNIDALYAAAKKPIGGTRPGSPQTMKSQGAPEDAVKMAKEAGKTMQAEAQKAQQNPAILDQAISATTTGAAAGAVTPSAKGGRKLDPRKFGG